MKLEILACQIDVPVMTEVTARDRHLDHTAALVCKQLEQQCVDIVVLPELSSIDYSRQAFANLDQLAEPINGTSYNVWRETAIKYQCWVLYGFAHRRNDGYSIASAIVDPAGNLAGVYYKLHLAQFGDSMEKEYFIAGEQQLLAIEINGFKISPIICYDIRVPELCRSLVIDHQVDVILHCGAYARDPSFYSWHAFVTTRAIENQSYVLSLNRAGKNFGHSVFCKPWVDDENPPVTFDTRLEQCKYFTLKQSDIEYARHNYTFLKDRLDSYCLPVRKAK